MTPTGFPSRDRRQPVQVDPDFEGTALAPPAVVVRPELEALELRYDRPIMDVRMYLSGSERIPENDVTDRFFDRARSGSNGDSVYVLTLNDEPLPEAVTMSYELVLSSDYPTPSLGAIASWGPDITIGPRG